MQLRVITGKCLGVGGIGITCLERSSGPFNSQEAILEPNSVRYHLSGLSSLPFLGKVLKRVAGSQLQYMVTCALVIS